jgi:hypothetical protein
MTDTQTQYQAQPPKKSGRGKGLLIAAVVIGVGLLMGSCAWGFVGMFKNASAMAATSEVTVERFHTKGFPEPSDPIWSKSSGVDERGIARLQAYADIAGPFESASSSMCSANTSYSTNEASGQFVSCPVNVEFEKTAATITLRWRKEGDEWRIFAYNLKLATDPRIEEAVDEALAEKDAAPEPTETASDTDEQGE